MKLNDRNIFFLDGVGALLSATFTGFILPPFSRWIGLPTWVLYYLASFSLVCFVYSLSCYKLTKVTRPWMLTLIITANLFYCLLAGLLVVGMGNLTIWGRILLGVEIIIILAVVVLELRIYRKTFLFT